jgi:Lrp/AsnC family leucine-responsive transcriptional regulator
LVYLRFSPQACHSGSIRTIHQFYFLYFVSLPRKIADKHAIGGISMAGRARELDKIDQNILRVLQEEGRISFTELGERVGLSTTPCTERVRRLERDGVITGYHARLDPRLVGSGLLVFVEISLSYKSGDIFEGFRNAALRLPNVLECHLVSGDFDYLIKARISEMASYRKLLGSTLLTMPNVRDSKSYIVMEEVKETLSLPIGPLQ